jgi:hypothetical protein
VPFFIILMGHRLQAGLLPQHFFFGVGGTWLGYQREVRLA